MQSGSSKSSQQSSLSAQSLSSSEPSKSRKAKAPKASAPDSDPQPLPLDPKAKIREVLNKIDPALYSSIGMAKNKKKLDQGLQDFNSLDFSL